MPKVLQFRRGTTSEISTITGAVGELFVDTTKDTVVVHDGSTQGGFPLQKELVSGTSIKTVNGTSILGSGNISITGGGGASYEIGDVASFVEAPGEEWLETGQYYSKSEYPALAQVMGDIPDIVFPNDEVLDSEICVPFGSNAATSTLTMYSTNVVATNPNDNHTYVVGLTGTSNPAIRKTKNNGLNWVSVNPIGQTTLRGLYIDSDIMITLSANAIAPISISYDNGINWIDASLTTNNLSSTVFFKVIKHNNLYIAIGEYAIIYSSNGLNWQFANIQVPNFASYTNYSHNPIFHDVIFSGTNLIAVGSNGAIYISTNGIDWENKTTGSNIFYTVFNDGNGRILAAGAQGTVVSTDHGATWSNGVLVSGRILRRIAKANISGTDRYVAVGSTNFGEAAIFTSINGTAWTAISSNFTNSNYIDVQFCTNKFIACGDNGLIAKSSDGTTWTQERDSTLSIFTALHHFTSNGITIAFGREASVIIDGASRKVVLENTTTNFTTTRGLSQTQKPVQELCAYDAATSKYILAHSRGFLYSSDAINWSSPVFPTTTENGYNAHRVMVVNGVYFAPSNSTTLVSTNGGTSWQSVTGTSGIITTVTRGAGVYVATSSNGIFSSTDGVAWTSRVSGAAFIDIVFANGRFVAVGQNTARVSTDGINWSTPTGFPNNRTMTRVVYHPTHAQYVSCGDQGAIFTSVDGSTWTLRTSNASVQLNDIAVAGNTTVVVGNNGVIVTATTSSFSFISTTFRQFTHNFNIVIHANNRFHVSNTVNNTLLNSTNGITWERCNTAFAVPQMSPDSLQYINNTFISVFGSSNGGINYSTDGISWKRSTTRGVVNTGAGQGNRIYKLNNKFFVTTPNGLYVSDDLELAQTPADLPLSIPVGVVYHNNEWYVAMTGGGGSINSPTDIYKSADAVSWTKISTLFTDPQSFTVTPADLIKTNNNLILASSTGTFTSSDGITWTIRNTSTAIGFQSIATDGTTVVLGGNGRSYGGISYDEGVTWETGYQFGSTVAAAYYPNIGSWHIGSFLGQSLDKMTNISLNININSCVEYGDYVIQWSPSFDTRTYVYKTGNTQVLTMIAPPQTGDLKIGFKSANGTGIPSLVDGDNIYHAASGINFNVPQNLFLNGKLFSYDTDITFLVPVVKSEYGTAYVYAGS